MDKHDYKHLNSMRKYNEYLQFKLNEPQRSALSLIYQNTQALCRVICLSNRFVKKQMGQICLEHNLNSINNCLNLLENDPSKKHPYEGTIQYCTIYYCIYNSVL